MTKQKRTQEESEQTAKVWMLDAVESKVDQALKILERVEQNTSGLVSQSELATVKIDMQKETDTKIDEAIEKVHLEYRPFKKGAYWLATLIISALVVQFVALATRFYGDK